MSMIWGFLNRSYTNRPLQSQKKTRSLILLIRAGPEVIKLFSCSTQLSLKFQILIDTEIAQIY